MKKVLVIIASSMLCAGTAWSKTYFGFELPVDPTKVWSYTCKPHKSAGRFIACLNHQHRASDPSSWSSFTEAEYGPDWANWNIAAKKGCFEISERANFSEDVCGNPCKIVRGKELSKFKKCDPWAATVKPARPGKTNSPRKPKTKTRGQPVIKKPPLVEEIQDKADGV